MSAIMNGAISSHFFNLKAAKAIGLTGPIEPENNIIIPVACERLWHR
jgi:hypothetical protein